MEAITERLAAMNLELPKPGAPKANYVSTVPHINILIYARSISVSSHNNMYTYTKLQQLVHRDGDLLYLSGHLPFKPDGTLVIGACAPSSIIEGDTSQKYISTEEGYEAAKHCALNLLSTVQSYLSEHVTIINPSSGVRQPADLSHVVKIIKIFGIVRSHDEYCEQHLGKHEPIYYLCWSHSFHLCMVN